MRKALMLVALGILLSGCQTAQVSIKPCGVIEDSLRDVQGKTAADTRRIDIHHARGKAAGCW